MARLCEAFSWKQERPGSAKACLQYTSRQPRMGQPWLRPKARLQPLKPEPMLPLEGLERRARRTQGQTVQQQRPKPPVLGTWRGAPRRLLTSALYSTKAALLQAPGLHDAAQELGASHCQCETKAKLGGPKQRRSHLCHRGTPSWSCGVLAPVSGAPGARAVQPKTEPLLWMNAACIWPLLLGKGGPTKTRPGAKSGGLRHKRPAQKPGQDCQRQSQVRQRRRKGCQRPASSK